MGEAAPQAAETTDQRLRNELLAMNPLWDIWYIPHTEGPTVWCVRPKNLPHHEDSAGALGKWLDEQRRTGLGRWLTEERQP